MKSTGGGQRAPKKTHLLPLSSRAKRGDPVNKKALRAFARRHIALDCHSRTTTFSTLIVLLRNDRDRVYPNSVLRPNNPPHHFGIFLFKNYFNLYIYLYIFSKFFFFIKLHTVLTPKNIPKIAANPQKSAVFCIFTVRIGHKTRFLYPKQPQKRPQKPAKNPKSHKTNYKG